MKDKLQVRHVKNKDWKPLYEICNTDENFKNREELAPGYLTAIMVLSYEAKPAVGGERAQRRQRSGQRIR